MKYLYITLICFHCLSLVSIDLFFILWNIRFQIWTNICSFFLLPITPDSPPSSPRQNRLTRNLEIHLIFSSTLNLKGGLSGQMTWQFLSALELFLFSTKKSPKVVNLALTDKKLCLNFWHQKQANWFLQFSKLSWGSYVSF